MSDQTERKQKLTLIGKLLKEEISSIYSDLTRAGKNSIIKVKTIILALFDKAGNSLSNTKNTVRSKSENLAKAAEEKIKETAVTKTNNKGKSLSQLLPLHKKNIAIACGAAAALLITIIVISSLQDSTSESTSRKNASQGASVEIDQPNTYTLEGPKGLSMGPFYLKMDINQALNLLNTTFKEQLLEDEGVPGKPNYRKVEVQTSGRRLHLENGYLSIKAASNGIVRSIYLSAEAMEILLSTSPNSPTEFAQKLINEKRIPELLVERQDDGFWWFFESPHGYRLEINQKTKAVRIYLTE